MCNCVLARTTMTIFQYVTSIEDTALVRLLCEYKPNYRVTANERHQRIINQLANYMRHTLCASVASSCSFESQLYYSACISYIFIYLRVFACCIYLRLICYIRQYKNGCCCCFASRKTQTHLKIIYYVPRLIYFISRLFPVFHTTA